MSATFDVIPVIEQGDTHDRHEVQLSRTPQGRRTLARAICIAVLRAQATGNPIHRRMLTAGAREIDEFQSAALDDVEFALASALNGDNLTPDEATSIGHALLEAAEPPAKCEGCGHVIDSDMTGNECRLCVDTPRGRRSA